MSWHGTPKHGPEPTGFCGRRSSCAVRLNAPRSTAETLSSPTAETFSSAAECGAPEDANRPVLRSETRAAPAGEARSAPCAQPAYGWCSRPCLELGQPALEEIDHLHRRRIDLVEEGEVEADEIARVNQREEPGDRRFALRPQ